MDLDTEVGTYASLCNTLSSNKRSPKAVKILALKKGLDYKTLQNFLFTKEILYSSYWEPEVRKYRGVRILFL